MSASAEVISSSMRLQDAMKAAERFGIKVRDCGTSVVFQDGSKSVRAYRTRKEIGPIVAGLLTAAARRRPALPLPPVERPKLAPAPADPPRPTAEQLNDELEVGPAADPLTLTIEQVCDRLGRRGNRVLALQLLRAGHLKGHKVAGQSGPRWEIDAASLDAYLEIPSDKRPLWPARAQAVGRTVMVDIPDDLVPGPVAAEKLGITSTGVYGLVQSGALRGFRTPKVGLMVPLLDVEAELARRERKRKEAEVLARRASRAAVSEAVRGGGTAIDEDALAERIAMRVLEKLTAPSPKK